MPNDRRGVAVIDMSATMQDLPGLWRRTLLVGTDGREDTTTDVRWIQSADLYVDLRIPADDDGTVEGFAGILRVGPAGDHDDVFHWIRDIDLSPPADSPDVGALHFEDAVLVETGVYENYVERWVKADDAATQSYGVRLRGADGEEAILVRTGSFFAWAQSVPGVGGHICMGECRVAPWTITATSAKPRYGSTFAFDPVGVSTDRTVEIVTDEPRLWTIYFTEGELFS